MQAQKLAFVPEDGMKVILRGRVSSFVRDGQYQIYVTDIQPDGVGSLYLAFEQLKRKLENEGLFDPSRKRSIPKLPRRVGIVTSPTGAAIRDMINIFGRRFPYTELVLYPALVQGPGAAEQIIKGIKYFNDTNSVNLIIVGRGGGSMEDLWAFNDERLARCIASSPIPIISAVGHETDFTISDFAADLRAPTPSAAAELAVPETEDIKRRLENINTRNRNNIQNRISFYKSRLEQIQSVGVMSSPERLLDGKRMNVLYCSEKLQRYSSERCGAEKIKLAGMASKLEALNPLGIISRGYSAVTDAHGSVIRSAGELMAGDLIKVRFADGAVSATVNGKESIK
jgi:exodeoxyribonuclease VII large subunit